MDDQEIWRAFDSHPEGLNEGEVAAKILKHGDNQIPAQKPLPGGGCICGPAIATRSTCC